MKNNDVELIRNVLAGDEIAFSTLVEKYQKQVHALAWRKIGDFHIAEEITQDTFLKVYQKLASLKQPHRFAGWLYVIATHSCQDRLRKKKIETESLEEMDSETIETDAYSRFVAEQEAEVTDEAQRGVVKKLLSRLPESERTVITLHYFGEMTCERISEFLGVSVNTIKSRLRRGRNRLKKEEPMIREAISNFQLSPNLTENIMQEVSRIKLTTPSSSKPMMPWVLGVSSAVIIALILGIGSQYLSHFQRPYSLDAPSEMTVDIVDSPIVQNLEAIPANRNQIGKLADKRGGDDGNGNESNQVIGGQGNYIKWKLPEKAKFRLGKGKISNYEGHLTTIGKGRSYHFTPNSSQFLVMTSIGIWSYDVLTGEELRLSTGPGIGMNDVVLSPDLRTYIKTPNNKIEIWDVHSDQLMTTLEGHNQSITSVAYSPNGKMLASSDFAGIIRIWEIENGSHRVISTPHKIVDKVMFSPDSKTLVSNRNEDVRLWDTETGVFKVKLEDTKGFNHIRYDTIGSALYGISREDVRFWDTNSGKKNKTFSLHQISKSFEIPLALSPDGKTLAIEGADDYSVELWDTQNGKLKKSLAGDQKYVRGKIIVDGNTKWKDYPTKDVESIAYSHDGSTLAVGSEDEIVIWDLETSTRKLTLTGEGTFFYLMFSPDGDNIVARSFSTQNEIAIYMWNIKSAEKNNYKPIHIIEDHNHEVFSIAFNPDGKTLVSTHNLEKMKLWDVLNGQLKAISNGYKLQTQIHSVAISPNAELISGLSVISAKSYNVPAILFWDAVTGEYLSSLNGHDEKISNSRPYGYGGGIAFSSDGKTLVSGSIDGTVRLWDMKIAKGKATGKLKTTLKGHTDSVLCIDMSPDGRIIASGSSDKTVHLWDVRNRKVIAKLEGHLEEILSVAFSPNGSTLATGSREGAIHLWDSTTGKHKSSLKGNELFKRPASLPRKADDPPYITGYANGPVRSLVFSPDGKTLVSGDAMKIYFWDMSTHKIKSTVFIHQGLFSLAFSPDGSLLASGSSDGTVLIWDVKP